LEIFLLRNEVSLHIKETNREYSCSTCSNLFPIPTYSVPYPSGERSPHLKILINQKNQDFARIYWKLLRLKNGLKFSKNIGNLLKFERKLIQKFENGLTNIVRKIGCFSPENE